jgi:MGT family glycosyltransferase
MTHIAMVSIPFPGHVNPSLALIRELVRRGHRVTYANDERFGDQIRSAGAELKPYVSKLPAADGDWEGDAVDHMTLFLDDAIAMLPQLAAAYDDDRPDLFLYDIAGAPARILGERWGIPAVQLSPTIVAWEGFEEEMPRLSGPKGDEYYRRFTEWLTAEGSSVTDGLAFMGLPRRGVVLIPRAMQPHADRVDEDVYTFAGPFIDDRGGSWTRP